jgi:bifunctional N-acetylglucosamine-1-phosphate-uridyltransferase/glucosamine-1-phosphate-acetyltransferase GlmU-like protein
MQIVIPMSGTGQRFIDAGYTTPKPLIEVDGKPIIEHVVNLFPGENDFIFICSQDHLNDSSLNLESTLKAIAPYSTVVGIEPHKKGPVYAVSKVFDLIDDDGEVIVNYCDFSSYWDYPDFLRHTRDRGAHGAIPSYRGFHPHMLGTTNYAFIRDENQWMLEIKEKEPFTSNRMNEFASNGTYYFQKGEYVKKYFTKTMEDNIHVNNEYYASVVFNLLRQDGLNVSVYEVQHMLQWGTPGDVEEYQRWSDIFSRLIENSSPSQMQGIKLLPLAGSGSRFVKEGYSNPKPLIEVSGKSMAIQAVSSVPSADLNIFVCQNEHLKRYPLSAELSKTGEKTEIVALDSVTEGQAVTCLFGLENQDFEQPLLITACDHAVIYDKEKYEQLLADSSTDVIVWTFRQHPSSRQNPEMYGWVESNDQGDAIGVSVKKAISSNPFEDHAIVGTFTFKKGIDFIKTANELMSRDERVNGEFYVDSCIGVAISQGLKVKVMEVDHYICWGTPNDLKTFEYWQSFFHKCSWHPYRLEKDYMMNAECIDELEKKICHFEQRDLAWI